MKLVVSNHYSLLLGALELALDQSKHRRWVVFASSAHKNYFYSQLATKKRPRAIEPFYIHELFDLLCEKRPLAPLHRKWKLEQLIQKQGWYTDLGPEIAEKQERALAARLAHAFRELDERYVSQPPLEGREKLLWDALYAHEQRTSELVCKIPEGVELFAFGFSELPPAIYYQLNQLSCTLFLIGPSTHYASPDSLLGSWVSDLRPFYEQLEIDHALMAFPKALESDETYAPLLGDDVGLLEGPKNRLAFLRAELMTGNSAPVADQMSAIERDTSLICMQAADPAGAAANLVKEWLNDGLSARESVIYAPRGELSAVSSALSLYTIPHALASSQARIDDPLLFALVTALRLESNAFRPADLNIIARAFFPNLCEWTEQIGLGIKGFEMGIRMWVRETLNTGRLSSASTFAQELALLEKLVFAVQGWIREKPALPSVWSERFSNLISSLLYGEEMRRVLDALAVLDDGYPGPISYSSAVDAVAESVARTHSSWSWTDDKVRIAPLESGQILPAKRAIVIGLDMGPSESVVDGLRSHQSKAGEALMLAALLSSDALGCIYSDAPGPALGDLIARFELPVERRSAPALPSPQPPRFATLLQERSAWPQRIEPTPCSLSHARFALSNPLGFFRAYKTRSVDPWRAEPIDPLFPNPLERTRALRACGALCERPGPLAEAFRPLATFDLRELSSRVFTQRVTEPISWEGENFYPSQWIEGVTALEHERGLVIYGRDKERALLRHIPDLALMKSAGRSPALWLVDLDVEIRVNLSATPEAISRFVALAQELAFPLTLPIITHLLDGSIESAVEQAREIDSCVNASFFEWLTPLVKEVYGGI
jgi:hypothetical protein